MSLRVRRIIWKDLLVEVRNIPELGSAVVFSTASSSLLGFSVSRLSLEPTLLLTVGLIMVELFLAVFTSLMGVVKEEETGTLDGLRSSPIDPSTVFLAKLTVNVILLETLTSISLMTTLLFSGAVKGYCRIIPMILSLGIYLAAISSFSSALSIYLQARGILLPTMILVLSLPAIQEALTFMLREEPLGPLVLSLSGLAFTGIASWLSSYVLD